MEELIGFILVGFALAGSPGPATLSVAASASAYGPRQTLPYASGIVAGMIVVMVLIATGVVGMISTIPGAVPFITSLAALYILYLAYRIATAPPLTELKDSKSHPSFIGGMLLSFINPKGYAAMAALFSSFILQKDHLVQDALYKIGVMVGVMTLVYALWLFVGTALNRVTRNPRLNRVINIAFAGILLVSVIFAFLL